MSIRVPKWDAKNKRHVIDPKTGQPEYVEVPLGAELDRVLASEPYAGRTLGKNKSDSAAGLEYLRQNSIRIQDVYAAYKPEYANLNGVEMRALLADTGIAPLFPALTIEGVEAGFNGQAASWQDLIANTVDVTTGSVEDFQFLDNATTEDDYILKLVGEGARIPTSRIVVSGRKVYITDKGRGVDFSDRAQLAPVSLSDTWLQKLGRRMSRWYYKYLGDLIRTGYFDDGSDAPHVEYTATPGTWTLADVLGAIDYLQEEVGFQVTDIMANSTNLITLETMVIPGGGGYVFPNGVADRLQIQAAHRNNRMGADEIAFFDRTATFVQYVLKPFGTESERTAAQQITSLYATVSDQIVLGDPTARILLSKATH